jgi:hypothetical protein
VKSEQATSVVVAGELVVVVRLVVVVVELAAARELLLGLAEPHPTTPRPTKVATTSVASPRGDVNSLLNELI